MTQELEHDCPECDTTRLFYRAASTNLHLGHKVKWRCPECDYGFVLVNNHIDTSTA